MIAPFKSANEQAAWFVDNGVSRDEALQKLRELFRGSEHIDVEAALDGAIKRKAERDKT